MLLRFSAFLDILTLPYHTCPLAVAWLTLANKLQVEATSRAEAGGAPVRHPASSPAPGGSGSGSGC